MHQIEHQTRAIFPSSAREEQPKSPFAADATLSTLLKEKATLTWVVDKIAHVARKAELYIQ